jgi:hypothetical protein
VPEGEKLKSEVYQLFGNAGQHENQRCQAADNAGAAISAGWFTDC